MTLFPNNSTDLADAFDEGWVTTGNWGLIDKSTIGLLKQLNTAISNFAVTRFHDLLYGKYASKPLKGIEAQKWDNEFVWLEQSQIAAPAYANASPDAIHQLNQMVRHEGSLGIATALGATGYIPDFSDYGISLEKNDWGLAGRVEIPMLMLYPDTYRPTLAIGLINLTGKNGLLTPEARNPFYKVNWQIMHLDLSNRKNMVPNLPSTNPLAD